ncbi:MAG: DNA mismatch repair endonuclease MutL [Myxococcales bacterium]|nr:DNA mismatch repair endonuclease MutL [Myxococcales bacterium]USN50076.1 MAG: DNA mismatch repair endonuclease MutL [Myxococcales bacterium]
MGKIIELSQHVSNQIAAGEVVERPSSVVKELIENALDAEATQIEVRIKDGGLSYIIVQDNGCGMDEDDVRAATKRYATSKISTAHDLESLSSFGFRGEALPSIASISRMSIISRMENQAHGTKALIDAGSIVEVSPQGALRGSRIEVRDLFFNVPARLKFVKSQRAEVSAIDKLIRSFAFVYENVSWKFFSEDKLIFSSAMGEDKSLLRAEALLGKDTRGLLFLFEEKSEVVSIKGALCAPLLTRKDIRGINIFVNNRLVNDRKISGAIKAAFRTLLEVGKNPICAFNIEVPPDAVDVNVHPRKAEVRFVDERKIFSYLIHMLGEFLSTTPWLRAHSSLPAAESAVLPVIESSKEFQNERRESLKTMDFLLSSTSEPSIKDSQQALELQPEIKKGFVYESKHLLPARKFADLKVIGQLCLTYLLCESEEGMVVLDQHAAHERVTFEYLRSQKNKGVVSSPLLIPIKLDLEHHDMMLAESHIEDFHEFGIEMEVFGESSVVIRALPDFMKNIDAQELVKDILSEFLLLGRAESVDKIFDHVCATMACHGSVRAGQMMSNEQISALLDDLDKIPFAAHCPHGRPIIKNFSKSELKKWFDRT